MDWVTENFWWLLPAVVVLVFLIDIEVSLSGPSYPGWAETDELPNSGTSMGPSASDYDDLADHLIKTGQPYKAGW